MKLGGEIDFERVWLQVTGRQFECMVEQIEHISDVLYLVGFKVHYTSVHYRSHSVHVQGDGQKEQGT